MKKLTSLFLALALVVSTGIVGCGGGVDNTTKSIDSKGKRPTQNTAAEDENANTKNKKATIAGGDGTTETPPD